MNQSDLIITLKSKCQNIKNDWEKHLEFWEGEEPGSYNDISVIVHYVIKNFESQNTNDFKELFEVIEEAVNSSEEKTSELAVIGFLEGILFVGSHKNIRPKHFYPWLGENSKKSILELEDYFNGIPETKIN